MADIVWNLRNDVPCNGDIGCAWELCHQAADEIERLRAALGLFACDCIESGNLCYAPQNCRNYIARAALEEGRT